jgi:hypothetical protein
MPSWSKRGDDQLRLVDLDLVEQDERHATRVLEVALGLPVLAELLARLRTVAELGECVGELDVEQRARREVRLQACEEGLSVLERHRSTLRYDGASAAMASS